jgi:hypothetical protein
MFKNGYGPKWGCQGWMTFSTIIVIGIGTVTVGRTNDIKDNITGAVSKAEPQDGTLAHPYADANQCPPRTDIVIWPEEWRSTPNIPSVFSVCFVGGQPKNNNGGGLELRGR